MQAENWFSAYRKLSYPQPGLVFGEPADGRQPESGAARPPGSTHDNDREPHALNA
jgi:hypothetical protein